MIPDPELTTGTQRAGALAAATHPAYLRQRLRDYVTLTKPHIISLLLVTTVAPMIAAAGSWPSGWLILWTMLGGYMMAGSANATNMLLDRDIDLTMSRTRLRPLPAGRMTEGEVLTFAALLGSGATIVLATQVNWLAAALSLSGWVWYVGVYTKLLKRSTPQNIVIGGAAGAFPTLVGWAAVAGDLSPTAWTLFLVVFLWTPPHFWALALVKRREYERAGVPMAPTAWGERKTKREMVIYAAALVAASLVPTLLGTATLLYAAAALILGGWYFLTVYRLLTADELIPTAWVSYRASLLYLALLFTALAADALLIG